MYMYISRSLSLSLYIYIYIYIREHRRLERGNHLGSEKGASMTKGKHDKREV